MIATRLKLFTLYGAPVYLDGSWLLVVAMVAWSLAVQRLPRLFPEQIVAADWLLGALGAVGLFASVLVHELAHARVAHRAGVPVRGVTLYLFGGVADPAGEPPGPAAELLTALAGPLASLGLFLWCHAGAAWLALPGSARTPLEPVLGYLASVNLALGAGNLVPAYPLDGGRLLRALWWRWSGDRPAAYRVAARAGALAGVILIGIGVVWLLRGRVVMASWYLILGWFVRGLSGASYRRALLRRALEGQPVRRFMRAETTTVGPELSVQAFVDHYLFHHTDKVYPVVDRGRFWGCVSLDAALAVPKLQWRERRVGDIADVCTGPHTVRPDDDALEALGRMHRAGTTRLLVTSDGRLDGVLALNDLLDYLALESLEPGARGRLGRLIGPWTTRSGPSPASPSP